VLQQHLNYEEDGTKGINDIDNGRFRSTFLQEKDNGVKQNDQKYSLLRSEDVFTDSH